MNDRLLSAEEFWETLAVSGVILTDDYTADGKTRFCKKRDNELFTVAVHDVYPEYLVNKVLEENDFFSVPIYTSGQKVN